MYCRNCGELLNDNDKVCPACGTPVKNVSSQSYSYGNRQSQQDQTFGTNESGQRTYEYHENRQPYEYSGPQYQGSIDSGSPGWGFLGCCLPLVGLILFLVWKDSKPRSAKAAGIGALIGVGICVLLYVLLMILGLSMGAIAVGLADGEIDMSELEDLLDEGVDIIANKFTALL